MKLNRVEGNPEEIGSIRVIQNYEEIYNALSNGESVMHWEFGDSMFPILLSGEYCLISPIDDQSQVNEGDAVFCRMGKEHFMVHRVIEKFTREFGGSPITFYKIGTTSGYVYGWTHEVFGIAQPTGYIKVPDETEG